MRMLIKKHPLLFIAGWVSGSSKERNESGSSCQYLPAGKVDGAGSGMRGQGIPAPLCSEGAAPRINSCESGGLASDAAGKGGIKALGSAQPSSAPASPVTHSAWVWANPTPAPLFT